MTTQRAVEVSKLAERIAGLNPDLPLRVAVDGRTASGKTTLAGEMAEAINALGRPTIYASIDSFHRPKAERYRRGRMSAEGYYRDGRDLEAVISLLLAPLADAGTRLIRTESFDLEADQAIEAEPWKAPENAVLIVDGTFLQRPELAPHWDAVIYVDTNPELCLERGIARDSARMGGSQQVRRTYTMRYQPAYDLYEHEADPMRTADVIFTNDDPTHPHMTFTRDTLGRSGDSSPQA